MAQHCGVAGARFKPYIDYVILFAERRAVAAHALGSGRQNVFSILCVPGVRAFTCEEIDYGVMRFFGLQQLAAAFAKENGDGYSPDALARDAPIWTGGDHVANALFTPGRDPLYFLDF